MQKIKLEVILWIVTFMLFLSGCTNFEIIDAEDIDNYYGREYIEKLASTINFGTAREDDIYVALYYLYNDETIKEEHGETFEITAAGVCCFFYESGPRDFFKGYEGDADYVIRIENTNYRIKIRKEYKEKWEVIECSLAERQDWPPYDAYY